MNAALVEVRGLKKYYALPGSLLRRGARPVVKAVDGVSFSLHQGQTFGLVGESGSGKTTTAKLLLRLEQATEGAILFDGREIQHLPPRGLREYRGSVQAVFQDPYG